MYHTAASISLTLTKTSARNRCLSKEVQLTDGWCVPLDPGSRILRVCGRLLLQKRPLDVGIYSGILRGIFSQFNMADIEFKLCVTPFIDHLLCILCQ